MSRSNLELILEEIRLHAVVPASKGALIAAVHSELESALEQHGGDGAAITGAYIPTLRVSVPDGSSAEAVAAKIVEALLPEVRPSQPERRP